MRWYLGAYVGDNTIGYGGIYGDKVQHNGCLILQYMPRQTSLFNRSHRNIMHAVINGYIIKIKMYDFFFLLLDTLTVYVVMTY